MVAVGIQQEDIAVALHDLKQALLRVNGVSNRQATEIAQKFVQDACHKANDKAQWQAILNKNIQKIAQNIHQLAPKPPQTTSTVSQQQPSPPPASVSTMLPPPPIQQQQYQYPIPTTQPQWTTMPQSTPPPAATTDQALAACWAAPMYAAATTNTATPWQTTQMHPQNMMMMMPMPQTTVPMQATPLNYMQPMMNTAPMHVIQPQYMHNGAAYMAMPPMQMTGRLPTPPLTTLPQQQQVYARQTVAHTPPATTTATAAATAAVQAMYLTPEQQKLLHEFKSLQKWAQENLLASAKRIANHYISKYKDSNVSAHESQANKLMHVVRLMEMNEEQLLKTNKLTKEFVAKFNTLLRHVSHLVAEMQQKMELKQRMGKEKTPPLVAPGTNGIHQVCEEMDESMPLMEDAGGKNNGVQEKERKNTPNTVLSPSERLLELLKRNEKPSHACCISMKKLVEQHVEGEEDTTVFSLPYTLCY